MKKQWKMLGIIMVICCVFSTIGIKTPEVTYAAKLTTAQKKAYKGVIKKEAKKIRKDCNERNVSGKKILISYAYLDFNKDGIEDLIVCGTTDELCNNYGHTIYTYKKGKVKTLMSCGDGFCSAGVSSNSKYVAVFLGDCGEFHVYKRDRKLTKVYEGTFSWGRISDYDLKAAKKFGICDKDGGIYNVKDIIKWKTYTVKR